MLLGVVLLYVGVVLAVNGLWLVGQAQAAEERAARMAPRMAAAVGAAVPPGATVSAAVPPGDVVREAEAGEELSGAPVISAPRAERSPIFIQNREVVVINLFTGFVGIVAAITYLVQGNVAVNLASVRASGLILLFAFTYLWVALNQFLNAGGRAFGWYCLFVAITAIPAGIFTVQSAHGNPADLWLAANWFAWAVLWGMFWALLALEMPIAKFAGWLAVIEGIGTAWALGFAVLEGVVAF